MMRFLYWVGGLKFPTISLLSRATVWLRLPYLPLAPWTRWTLELVVAGVGRLVRLDPATELLTKGWFARVVIEIDLQ